MLEGIASMTLDDQTRQIATLYFDTFYSLYNSMASEPSQIHIEGYVQQSVQAMAPYLGEMGFMILLVHDSLGWASWNNISVRAYLAAGIIAQQAQVPIDIVLEVVSLNTIDNATFNALASQLVRQYDLADHPLPIPNALVQPW